MRVELAPVQNGMRGSLHVWKYKLRPSKKRRIDRINRSIPAGRLLLSRVAHPKSIGVGLEMATETRMSRKIYQLSSLPRVDEIVARPHRLTSGQIACSEQRKETILLDEIGAASDVHVVAAGRDTDAHAGAGGQALKWSEASLEISDQCEL